MGKGDEGCQGRSPSPQVLSQPTGCCLPVTGSHEVLALLSVALLPTIRETSEEMLPGGAGEEPPASPSLEDYVRSICQLAQPTSVLDETAARVRNPANPTGQPAPV